MNKKYFMIVLLCAAIPSIKAEAPIESHDTVEQENREKIPPYFTEEIIIDDEYDSDYYDDIDLDQFADELKEAADRPQINLTKRLRILFAVLLNASHVWYHSTMSPLLHNYWNYIIESLKEGTEDLDKVEVDEVIVPEGNDEQKEVEVDNSVYLEDTFFDENISHQEDAQNLQDDLEEQLEDLVEEMVEEFMNEVL